MSGEDSRTVPHIMIAEKDQVNLAILKHQLTRLKFPFRDVAIHLIGDSLEPTDAILMVDVDSTDGSLSSQLDLIRKDSGVRMVGITSQADQMAKAATHGVDEMLMRPIKLTELEAVLKTLLQTARTDTTSPILNVQTLYSTVGSRGALHNIFKLFLAQTPDNMRHFDMHCQLSNWVELGNICHKMKSVYSLLGLATIRQYLDEIENDCVGRKVDVVKVLSYREKIAVTNERLYQEMNAALGNN